MSMSILRKAYSAATETLAEQRQVRVICSTAEVDRQGEIIVQAGIDTAAYMASGAGTVLWNHNPDMPIAKCIDIRDVSGNLVALVQFPPAGEDPEADLYYSKIKFGSVSGVSIGFNPVEVEPLDKANPKRGPQKYLRCELMEFSFTPVQANRGAVVVERSTKGAGPANWKVGASRNLPLVEGNKRLAAAGVAILAHADFDSDSPDTAFARKGFLAYDAANPDVASSYLIPFATMVDGRLMASPAAVKSARAALMASDLPEDVTAKAMAVIDHYEGKMSKQTAVSGRKIKGLYEVSRLAYMLMELGWLDNSVEFEAACEEDGSQVPALLGAALRQLGDALIAMTIKEVNELFAEESAETEDVVAKGICHAAARPFTKAFVVTLLKAGRKFSGESISTMQDACKNILSGHDMIAGLLEETVSADESAAASDTDKAAGTARQKRLREVEVLRLAAV
ncbi:MULTISPECIES: hypothetical protein [unclassified Mesorhizobium]|uniref:HK97 family phage prohead protease n=1 Tax=unclassified Mesorhizobium TaxID=325217 RepID=UPI00095FC063|nr:MULTISPECIES: hypothetical protein [unclassified Mesorhizobium]MBN9255264.1 hypothetical protein [Mesorhizobium sp.]OJX74194.1 MAG: hypothetical protein BGO93_16695 [Mesorhizobium sp. 65-26]